MKICLLNRYLKGIWCIWFNKGNDNLLTFWFIIIPIILVPLLNIISTIYFSYLYINKSNKIHSFYYDIVDRAGIYRCRLHDNQFRNNCNEIIAWNRR